MQLKVKRRETKYILKRAARGIVPDDVIDREESRLLQRRRRRLVPVAARRRGSGLSARALAAVLRSSSTAACVRELVRAHRDGTTNRQHLLLSILMLEVWLTDFLPRATAHATATEARVRMTCAPLRSHHARAERGGSSSLARRRARDTDVKPGALDHRRQRLDRRNRSDGERAGGPLLLGTRLDTGHQGELMRGGPIVRAFHAASRATSTSNRTSSSSSTRTSPSKPDYFERLLTEFENDAAAGDRERQLLRARQRRRLASTAWHGCRRLGGKSRLPLGVSPITPPTRGADGLGHTRPLQGFSPGLDARVIDESAVSATIDRKACATAAARGRGRAKAGRPTTWATASPICSRARRTELCATRRPCRC